MVARSGSCVRVELVREHLILHLIAYLIAHSAILTAGASHTGSIRGSGARLVVQGEHDVECDGRQTRAPPLLRVSCAGPLGQRRAERRRCVSERGAAQFAPTPPVTR